MTESWIGYAVVGLLGYLTYKIYIYPYYLSPTRRIPGPPPENYFLGNLIKIAKEEPGEPYLEWAKKYGNIVCYHNVANRPFVSITDPKNLHKILVSNAYDFIKPPQLSTDLKAIMGNGILMAEGNVHKRQRKMMNSAFSFSNVKEMIPSFVRVGRQLEKIWRSQIDDKEKKIIISPWLTKATMDIIGLIGFGCEFNNLDSKNDIVLAYETLFSSKRTLLDIAITQLVSFFPKVRRLPLPRNIVIRGAIKIIEDKSKTLVKERKQLFRQGKNLSSKDLLSSLISINEELPVEEKMSDLELQYQIMTFLVAGHETTSSALSFILYFLAQNPDVQDHLRKELCDAFPDPDFIPSFDNLNSLEYLSCVIKESMRIAPSVPIILRAPNEDHIFGEYVIPKHTPIVIPIAAIHKLPAIWGEDAEEFKPERWLNPNISSEINNLNYLPFSTGPRSCIGNRMAMAEIKTLLSILIRRFRFRKVDGFKFRKRLAIASRPNPAIELMVSVVESA
ncbi:4684_t:CDS:2 [Acaulospora morrowiae]|uniref:4684_t:CDS:1 n=1 Tax=Acaulospora morrowiae TaxID=94023 RepID=A0A9N9CF81_9GLOM|nr:4684_t:CDS:2 [Acaulospora morrowiae]